SSSIVPTFRGAQSATHTEVTAATARTAPTMYDHGRPSTIRPTAPAAHTSAVRIADHRRCRTSARVWFTDLAWGRSTENSNRRTPPAYGNRADRKIEESRYGT